ncbi:MAG TPA: YgdI/YgdR family lipoprotein [Candidatus Binatia bacterium]|nr:YgdI/YgdR family lipoprotein [Candidatus Binatia bacterium]
MKIFLVIAVAVLLTGCARHYNVTLTNGNSFTTTSKPKLNKEGTAYLYKDRNGKPSWVPAGKVTEINRK